MESSFAHWDSALDSFFIVDLGVCIKGVEYLPQKVSWLGLVLILSGAGFIVAAAWDYKKNRKNRPTAEEELPPPPEPPHPVE